MSGTTIPPHPAATSSNTRAGWPPPAHWPGWPCLTSTPPKITQVEYTFADGARLFMHGRAMAGAHSNFSSALHGTKGCAVASRRGDCGGPSSTFEGHNFDGAKRIWQSETPGGEGNPYRNQWNALIDAIRGDEPFNEVEHGVMASVVSSLGRKAAHTAQEITLDAMLNSPDEYAPGLDEWTTDPPAPVQADDDGNYPIPMPGILTDREY